MLLQSGLKSPDSFPDVDLATTAWDPVHHLGLLVLRQYVLYSCETGVGCASRSEDHSDVENSADASDFLTHFSHIGDAHYGLVVLVINRIRRCRGVGIRPDQ